MNRVKDIFYDDETYHKLYWSLPEPYNSHRRSSWTRITVMLSLSRQYQQAAWIHHISLLMNFDISEIDATLRYSTGSAGNNRWLSVIKGYLWLPINSAVPELTTLSLLRLAHHSSAVYYLITWRWRGLHRVICMHGICKSPVDPSFIIGLVVAHAARCCSSFSHYSDDDRCILERLLYACYNNIFKIILIIN